MYPNRIRSFDRRLLPQILACLGLILFPVLGSSAPKAPGGICAKSDPAAACRTTPPREAAGAGTKKWHPGHYMQVLLNDSTDDRQATRFGWYDEIAANTSIEGVALRLRWGQLEARKGEYTFATLRAELDRLKSLPEPKRLFVRIHDRDYGSSSCDSDMYPADLRNPRGCAEASHGNLARIWDPAVTDRLIALYEAMAEEFDGDPYFEGIMPIRETATNGRIRDDSFSEDAYIRQLKRLAEGAAAAFERSNVVMPVNWLGGQRNVDELIEFNAKLGLGQGGPDVLPEGLAEQRVPAYDTLEGISTGVAYRDRMPVLYSIESTQLGGSLCKRCLPQDLHAFAETRLKATHLFWTRHDYRGSPAQQWHEGILPWINKNPLQNKACPANYAACSGD
ncbi:MAG: hypothetical protein JXB36_14205 [Gammaproteobacteria bacterium]|nr:hypothetical protein [Gammaproteobacteria bacterium]